MSLWAQLYCHHSKETSLVGRGRNKLFQFSGGARLNATVRVSVLDLRLLAGVGNPSSGLAHRGPGLLHLQSWILWSRELRLILNSGYVGLCFLSAGIPGLHSGQLLRPLSSTPFQLPCGLTVPSWKPVWVWSSTFSHLWVFTSSKSMVSGFS